MWVLPVPLATLCGALDAGGWAVGGARLRCFTQWAFPR